MMCAIEQDVKWLRYASMEVKDDLDIVLCAIKHHGGYALQYASHRLKNDRQMKALYGVEYFNKYQNKL